MKDRTNYNLRKTYSVLSVLNEQLVTLWDCPPGSKIGNDVFV